MTTRPFTARVIAAVRRIPPGRASTYGDIAALAGRPRAWRAVGSIMRTCDAPGTPCHRVGAAGGRLGGCGGNPGLKRAQLAAEGVAVAGTRIRNWRAVRWPAAAGPSRARNLRAPKSVSPGVRASAE